MEKSFHLIIKKKKKKMDKIKIQNLRLRCMIGFSEHELKGNQTNLDNKKKSKKSKKKKKVLQK